MPGTVSYLNHEPVWVVYNGVLLGLIDEGDATVTITRDWVDQVCHQTGSHLIESYFKGAQVTAEVTFAEVTNLDNWEVAFPTGEQQQDQSTPPTSRFVSGKKAANTPYIGTKASAISYEMTLRPVRLYTDVSTETAGDFVIPKAWCKNVKALTFGIDTAFALPMEFHGLYSPSASDGEYLWIYGKETGSGTWSAV